MRRRFVGAGLAVALLLGVGALPADAARCGGHGGVAGCDHSGQLLCQDGTLDRRFACSELPARPRKKKRELKFKRPPDRGQILKPGEKPPASTLEQSEKELKGN